MNIAVVFAGGVGSRMNTKSRPKQFLDLNGKPILIYTLELFDNHPQIDAIVCVCLESWIPYLKKMIRKFEINKVVEIVSGGKSGQDSIYNGLCAAECYTKEQGVMQDSIVLIHDGVRPLITEETITQNIDKVKECGSCITCVPAIETVIVAQQSGGLQIPKRSDCKLARAPQSFYLKDIIEAHRKNRESENLDFIDSCSLMSYYGMELGMIDGPMENIKITTPTDYFVFRAMVEVHENQQIFGFN
ncbi:MAG: 2-C-methyl-D-erythritol 4-phosphate cytidylyltransferase [Paludibacteraceae bacterium]|nr:2-C-methyl-D-erythritol 4-phosphate cytidylyltransferase [Paludibacteraceae bacterium]MCQ2218221.1 2-C-methyl-D-erythritol 4-phosphate cytidylyltransferase [Paludibacteraceae bacterium]